MPVYLAISNTQLLIQVTRVLKKNSSYLKYSMKRVWIRLSKIINVTRVCSILGIWTLLYAVIYRYVTIAWILSATASIHCGILWEPIFSNMYNVHKKIVCKRKKYWKYIFIIISDRKIFIDNLVNYRIGYS